MTLRVYRFESQDILPLRGRVDCFPDPDGSDALMVMIDDSLTAETGLYAVRLALSMLTKINQGSEHDYADNGRTGNG